MATEIKGRTFSWDEQGMLTWSVVYHCDSELDALTGVPAFYRGMPRKGHSGGQWDGNLEQFVVKANYRGIADGTTDPEAFDDYRIDGELREEPIETFPFRESLIAHFGAFLEDGKIKFPEKVPEQRPTSSPFASGIVPFAKSNLRGGESNPLFNVTTYPVSYDMAEHSYVRLHVPAAVNRRALTVVETLPSGFDYDGDAEGWFYQKPTRIKVGNAWRITERAQEINQLKHVTALYGLIQR